MIKENEMNKKNWWLFILSIAILLFASVFTMAIDTTGGRVTVKQVDFVGEGGTMLHARLYIPDGVSSANPAPGVVFIHGGDASSDKYSMFSVEFSRRGYVVLNFDLRGHGFSEGPAELPFGPPPEHGMGGPEALQYLRSLDIVDKSKIACAGHSMGGMACEYAAMKYPTDYTSLVLLGATPDASIATTQRNTAVIHALDDGQLVGDSPFAAFTGVTDVNAIVSGKVYGSIDAGTGHVVYFINTVHNAEYITPAVIEKTVDWIQTTIPAPNPIDPSNQIWIWRYVGSTIGLGGAVFFMLMFGSVLLSTPYFKPLAEPLPVFKGFKGKAWWIPAILSAVIGPVTLFYFNRLTAKNPAIWPYARITGIMGWTFLVAVVAVILILLTRFVLKGIKEVTTDSLGLTWEKKLDWSKIGKSLLLSVCIIATTYLIVAIVYNVFHVDFRMWNEGLRTMTLGRIGSVLLYVIPFMLAYIVYGANLHGLLRPKNGNASFGFELLTNILIMAPWYYGWAIFWGPFTYLKTHPGGPPFALGFMQHWFWALAPVMLMWSVISTYFYRKTGKVYVGAFIDAFFVCWVILAEQMLASFVLG
jgi:pimeloyl-ACP methyl ester carboxylesterase